MKYEVSSMLTGDSRHKFPRDLPATSGSSPGRWTDKIEMREGNHNGGGSRGGGGGGGYKLTRDMPASSGSSFGRLRDKIEMRKGKDKEVEGLGNKWGE